ncbi:MAG: D-tyrosyl-tRNA(Tyr) deacylase [Spirochaetales bacterium]|nr:D-tyrosyl-tRNA(Tyr) deacylase [Spirochaetales bacterium]
MRSVVQRVRDCSVTVEGMRVGFIERGILVYLGIGIRDTELDASYMAEKIVHLRLYPDDKGKMNLSVQDVGGRILVVSQFTLYGDTRKGRRPSYDEAAPPDRAEPLYQYFLSRLATFGIEPETGTFQAKMEVSYINEGPVTLLIDSEKIF